MDPLDKLKDIWGEQKNPSVPFKQSDIHKMIHQKSSSIVKWILIVSILEFIAPNIFILLTDLNNPNDIYSTYNLSNIIATYTIVHIIVILGFLFKFYKNYTKINAEDNVKQLLQNILKTRATVKYYIYYNIGMAAIIGIHVFYVIFNSEDFINKLPKNTNMNLVWLIAILLLAVSLFLFWVFYSIIYGFFLKKLKTNFNELDSGIETN